MLNPDLSEKIIETILSAVLNGLLLVIGSFVIARAIHRYKASLDLRVALATIRVKKIEEVSVLLFQLEVNIEQMSNDCLEFERKQAQAGNESHVEWAKEYVRLGRPVELQKKEVKKQIRLARFWLGKKLSKKFERHYGLLEEYLLLLDDRKFDEADKCWNKIEASKLSVLDFLENPDE